MSSATAPASSANLGPGYDCLALAVEMRCRVTAEPGPDWEAAGSGAEQSDDTALVLAAARRVSPVPLRVGIDSAVPVGKGLGSSAAVLVATVAAALRATGQEAAPDRVFRVASELEGHPDNVAAAVYGGLVLVPAEGLPIRLPIHPALRLVVAVPDQALPTGQARSVVDDTHPTDRVVRSLARVAALTAGLLTGDPGTLAAAHGDEIHEAPRSRVTPEVAELVEVARGAGAWHAARSGAGPSVLAICSVEYADQVAAALAPHVPTVLRPALATTGLA